MPFLLTLRVISLMRHSLGSQFLVHAKEIYLDSFHDLGVDVHPGWHGADEAN